MPSPRHLKCRWGGELVICEVGSALNFRKGMVLRGLDGTLARPQSPGGDLKLWRYSGKLPRRSGHW